MAFVARQPGQSCWGCEKMENIWITLIESVLTFAGICVTVYFTNKKSNKKLEEKVDTLVEHDEDQYLSILRLTIMSEEMPISERIIAGAKYVKKGGNGDVKKYYQKMLEEHTK
jgi:D-alanyl-lipoteichoic acid acyltransferase DltB (MBOAT superfamily)